MPPGSSAVSVQRVKRHGRGVLTHMTIITDNEADYPRNRRPQEGGSRSYYPRAYGREHKCMERQYTRTTRERVRRRDF